jgi:hypothetical protein
MEERFKNEEERKIVLEKRLHYVPNNSIIIAN